MYKIIGADGKEYGPVSAEQIRQWIAEGRANAATRVLPEGASEWKTIGDFPELGGVTAAPAPVAPAPAPFPQQQPYPGPFPAGAAAAQDQVNGPAIGLMIFSGLTVCYHLLTLVVNTLGMSMLQGWQTQGPFANDPVANKAMQIGGIAGAGLGLIMMAVIFFGALKMKKLENYGLAMTAAILAMLPCSICCIAGLPLGIWALVTLNKPEVKSAFR